MVVVQSTDRNDTLSAVMDPATDEPPQVVELTATDHINKTLLQSFKAHLDNNSFSSMFKGLPNYEEEEEEEEASWDANACPPPYDEEADATNPIITADGAVAHTSSADSAEAADSEHTEAAHADNATDGLDSDIGACLDKEGILRRMRKL
eukprot:CAMPEP_0177648628 /NCGR_PEP_ID=MMETSP0447-20121125/10927_1 /TAXON_ID=0 /ORGANISM="Stygamoeba regulata, Strain BSH-02190019" /LENGTH=149 /DNA_ID=CAMNT_0019151277 /DNA_START=116 /DNA_END=565 /DNA_ORIENTATION=+